MLSILLGLFGSLLSWLATVLPASPFASLSLSLSGVGNALGWLNWVVPVGQMATLFAAWLACVAVWQAVNFVVRRWGSAVSIVGAKG